MTSKTTLSAIYKGDTRGPDTEAPLLGAPGEAVALPQALRSLSYHCQTGEVFLNVHLIKWGSSSRCPKTAQPGGQNQYLPSKPPETISLLMLKQLQVILCFFAKANWFHLGVDQMSVNGSQGYKSAPWWLENEPIPSLRSLGLLSPKSALLAALPLLLLLLVVTGGPPLKRQGNLRSL